MPKKVQPPAPDHKRAPAPRRRVGPEKHPRDVYAERLGEFRRQAEETGDLIVDYPEVDGMEGGAWGYAHPAVGDLKALAAQFTEHARQHANGEAAAVGHILQAVSRAIEGNDLGALNAPEGPHSWARKYIRPDESTMAARSYLPIEASTGRLLDMDQIAPAFRLLSTALEWAIARARAGSTPLDALADLIAFSMILNFPSLASLSSVPPNEMERRAVVGARVITQLRASLERDRVQLPSTMAPDVAQELLETEFRCSGKVAEISTAFRFRKHH